MKESNHETIEINCATCGEVYEKNSMRLARKFAKRHQEHSGHDVTLEQINDPGLIFIERYRVFCMDCDEVWYFDEEKEAESFVKTHPRHAGHQIPVDIETIKKKIPAPDASKGITQSYLHTFANELEEMSEKPPSREWIQNILGEYVPEEELREAMKELKLDGMAYEPVGGRLKTI